MLGNKHKKLPRQRKTVKEKMDAWLEKYVFDTLKNNEPTRLAFIKKKYDIEILPESERQLNHLIEQTKLRVYKAVADGAVQDALADEDLRDKIISELVGVPYNPPRTKERSGRTQKQTFNSQLEKIKANIKYVKDLKELMGVNENSWTSLLKNPEIIKALMELIKGCVESRGSAQSSNTTTNNIQIYAVEIDGKYVEMNPQEYAIYCEQQKVLQQPRINPPPAQGENQDKPASDNNPTDNTGAQK